MGTPPEEEIRATMARYAMLLDDGRFEEWADLFTEDAQFHVMGQTQHGRADIQAWITQAQPPKRRGKHVLANSLIEVDGWGGTATAWTDYIFVAQDGTVTSQGRYHDRLERGGDKRWRFTLREIVFRGDGPQLTDPPPA
jgi:uncharacterized protein (TIGR02246 family)